MLSWLFVGTLFVLCGVLGVMQYRWIDELSVAARERLHGSLQATLLRLGQGFNTELATAVTALLPANARNDSRAAEAELAARFAQWRKTTRHGQLFRRLAISLPQQSDLRLRMFDLERGAWQDSSWPDDWSSIRTRMEFRLTSGGREGGRRGGPGGPGDDGPGGAREAFTFDAPVFGPPQERPSPGPFGRRESMWLIFDLNPAYLREALLPEILQRYLGTGGVLDYNVEIVTRAEPSSIIYQSDPRLTPDLLRSSDASSGLFEPQQLWRPPGPSSGMRGPGGPGRGPSPDSGRWRILVRHRAGSLEAVVSQTRRRYLAITAGVLLLIVATAAALIHFTRRTQKLAALQMDFVAGVSHELRTPLTVIHTAAYNLRGKMAQNPSQVERYGALIQTESARLRDLVEQILRFATAEAGRMIGDTEPLDIASVIEEAVAANKGLLESSHCQMERNIAPALPLVLGDRVALRQAVENLVSNAAKYGVKGGNWIGISAAGTGDASHPTVEIRVADRGPGIPREEQDQVFDPFFRGARAIQDQIHGTGLGLSLVKRIVEAHGGTIRVESAPAKGTSFILRLPAAPNGAPA